MPPQPTPPHPISSVATYNVVNDPRDVSSVAIFHVRSTRNVNMPPHPTPQSRYSKTCVLRERFSVRRQKHVNIRSMRSETDIHVLSCRFTYMYVYMHIYICVCVYIKSYRMYIFYVFAQIHVCI